MKNIILSNLITFVVIVLVFGESGTVVTNIIGIVLLCVILKSERIKKVFLNAYKTIYRQLL